MKKSLSPAELPDQSVTDTNGESCSLKTEKMLTTDEAAAFLGITPGSLRNLVSQGRVPYYKFGRLNRFRRDELAQLLLSDKRGGTYGY